MRRTIRGTAPRAVRHRRWVSATVFSLLCFAVEPAFAQDLPRLSVADATANEADATIDFVVSLSASERLPGAELQWIAQSRLGYGIRLRRGSATPFVELDAGHSGRGGARFGVRHEFGDRGRGLVVEWGIEQSDFASAGTRILLEALGRF